MNSFFFIILGITLFNFILEQYLDFLNSKLWSNELPKELEGIYDAEKYRKSQDYTKVKTRFSLITDTFSLALILIMLFCGGFGIIDNFLRSFTENPILLSLLFFGVIGFASDLLSTPFEVYFTFNIEKKFGFNTTTIKTFILDKIKGWLIGLLIGGLLLAGIVWIYLNTGEYFWLFAWAAISFFMLFMTMFYSNLIVPLFNKQKPLEPGELRDEIEKFAKKVKFKLNNIYVIDGSKRSKKANAYFTGLGPKKRIVLYDTLIADHTKEELVAVLAHEIGHYKKKHTVSSMIIGIVETGAMLFILSIFISYPELAKALGSDIQSFHLGILAFALLYSPISLILGLFMNILSRKHEYEADRYAGENYNPESLKLALKKLSVNSLSNLRPHPLYVFFNYSHPTLLQRLKALDEIIA